MQEGKRARIAAAKEKHLFLSFSYEGWFKMLHARTDTRIIGLTSQFAIVPVGFEATRKRILLKLPLFFPKTRK